MQTVSTEVRGRTAIVTIERPQARNAVEARRRNSSTTPSRPLTPTRPWMWRSCRAAAEPSAQAPT